MARVEVQFTDPKNFFYPGETIAGNINVLLNEPVTCRGVVLLLYGESYSKWTEGSGNNREWHINNEVHLETTTFLLAPSTRHSSITLQPGNVSMPFRYKLPNDLPPSFEVKRYIIYVAYVRYVMHVKIYGVTSGRKADIVTTIPFQVLPSPVQFNQAASLLEPATGTEEKFLCCLCCRSGPILLRCQIEKQVYCLGETIVFSFEVDNKATNKALSKVEAKLIERVTFLSEDGYSRIPIDATKTSVELSDGVAAGEEASWNNVGLTIPTNIVPSFTNCKCVNLEYLFQVVVKIGSAINPRIFIPITISSGPVMTQPAAQRTITPENIALTEFKMDNPKRVSPPVDSAPTTSATLHATPTITEQPATLV